MSAVTGKRVFRRLACGTAVVVAAGVLGACSGGTNRAARPADVGKSEPVVTTVAPATTVAPSAGGGANRSSTGTLTTPRPAERLTDASRLRLDGIGPLRVGMSLAEASKATGMNVRITSQDFGNGCRYAEADGGPTGLAFMVFNGRIVRFDVNGEPQPSSIATLSGVRVGSTETDVMAAYPGRIRVTGNAYLEDGHDLVYTGSDSGLGLIFVTDGLRVLSFRSGEAGPVSAIEGCS